MKWIDPITHHWENDYQGIKYTSYNAGHVLGAAMFMVEIEGVWILYTGDYSREHDWHLKPAEIPYIDVDVLIVESTYGTNLHEPRDMREKNFWDRVKDIVIERKGKCLLPVLALGMA